MNCELVTCDPRLVGEFYTYNCGFALGSTPRMSSGSRVVGALWGARSVVSSSMPVAGAGSGTASRAPRKWPMRGIVPVDSIPRISVRMQIIAFLASTTVATFIFF